MRTFVAVDLDPAVKARLADLLRRLRWRAARGVTWTRESGLHITLKFLGEIDEARRTSVAAVLEEAARAVPAFPLIVRGTGAFPEPPRAPRVLWVGTDEPPAFAELYARVESGLAGLGFEREARPFHPHATLGRVKLPAGARDAAPELERVRGEEFGRMTVAKVTLFRSTLRPDGAVYDVLEEAPLA